MGKFGTGGQGLGLGAGKKKGGKAGDTGKIAKDLLKDMKKTNTELSKLFDKK